MSQLDREALERFAKELDIDFVSLSFTRSVDDVHEARDYLDSIGLKNTKVRWLNEPLSGACQPFTT